MSRAFPALDKKFQFVIARFSRSFCARNPGTALPELNNFVTRNRRTIRRTMVAWSPFQRGLSSTWPVLRIKPVFVSSKECLERVQRACENTEGELREKEYYFCNRKAVSSCWKSSRGNPSGTRRAILDASFTQNACPCEVTTRIHRAGFPISADIHPLAGYFINKTASQACELRCVRESTIAEKINLIPPANGFCRSTF